MKRFGPYQLVRQLAVGGMAEVYLAKTSGIAGFEKHVALKMIHPSLGEHADLVEMLVDEAKLAVQLSHPSIAQTFDLGRVDDTYYLTMEYIDGVDLSQLIRAARDSRFELPFDACASVAKDIASALDHAHQRGVIHRDVSPQNVLISSDGVVKLVDFGIAKAMMSARKTAVGIIKGKYAYMSPEQAKAEPLDGRSDIYSAGMVLYQMLTGRTLHDEADLDQLLDRVRGGTDPVPPSIHRAGVPSQLEAIVLRALAHRPGDRYQRAGQMAIDLQKYLYAASPSFVAGTLASLATRLLQRTVQTTVPEGQRLHTAEDFRDENSVLWRRRSSPHVIPRTSPRAARVGPTALVEDPSKQIEIAIDESGADDMDFGGESKQISIEAGFPRGATTDPEITYTVDDDDDLAKKD